MKKILFVATVVKLHIAVFHLETIALLKKNNYSVHVAAKNDYIPESNLSIPCCDNYFNVAFERFPLSFANIKALKQLVKLLNNNNYDLIHCHTPVGGLLGRLANAISKNNTKAIYTAHGFHFFKGAPLLNWLIYFPVEWLLSFFTDCLITINQEDYAFAKKYLHAKKVEYIPGVGIDLDKFKYPRRSRTVMRKELQIPEKATVLLSVGELNKNKNHETALKAFALVNNPNAYYIICGQGALKDYLTNLASKLGISAKTFFLGYRSDIIEIMKTSDIFIHPSFREGLPVSLMEAMASGLPCIASKIRGNADLIKGLGENYLFPPAEMEVLSNKISELVSDEKAQIVIGNENLTNIENFALDSVLKKNIQIYSSFKVS